MCTVILGVMTDVRNFHLVAYWRVPVCSFPLQVAVQPAMQLPDVRMSFLGVMTELNFIL
jgi:hypothetical protein